MAKQTGDRSSTNALKALISQWSPAMLHAAQWHKDGCYVWAQTLLPPKPTSFSATADYDVQDMECLMALPAFDSLSAVEEIANITSALSAGTLMLPSLPCTIIRILGLAATLDVSVHAHPPASRHDWSAKSSHSRQRVHKPTSVNANALVVSS